MVAQTYVHAARRQGRIIRAATLVLVLAASLSGTAAGAADTALEYKVKATYLYKFGAFVEWPSSTFESPNSPVNVCIAGHDPFDGLLDEAVAGQRIAERPIVVRRMQTVARNSGCQILYVGESDQQQTAQALDAVRGTGVLTVTDSTHDAGGIIRFLVEDNHVRFDIDEEAASRNGLTISSKLLSLASSFRARTQ